MPETGAARSRGPPDGDSPTAARGWPAGPRGGTVAPRMRAPESLRVAPIEEPDDGAVAALWDRCFGGGPVAENMAAERTHRKTKA